MILSTTLHESRVAAPLPAHRPAFDALASHLVAHRDEGVLFCPSPGNWGDSLINAGSREFLQAHRIPYREVRRDRLLGLPGIKDSHVLVGGGGGWCEFWHTTPELVVELLPKVRHVTVLPTTYSNAPLEIPESSNLTLFARDDGPSLEWQPEAIFCHDMAFHCNDGMGHRPGSGRLLAFREDKESRFVGSVPAENHDLSLEGRGFDDPRPLYKTLSGYAEIHTDRLHLAIASAQVGLDVRLYGTGYPKIEHVYSASLSGIFPNVIMGEDEERPQ